MISIIGQFLYIFSLFPFFSMGFTIAYFNLVGKVPDSMDLLQM